VSYGTNYPEAYRQAGDCLGRVLNGEKPENLPVQQVTKLQLVINTKDRKGAWSYHSANAARPRR